MSAMMLTYCSALKDSLTPSCARRSWKGARSEGMQDSQGLRLTGPLCTHCFPLASSRKQSAHCTQLVAV